MSMLGSDIHDLALNFPSENNGILVRPIEEADVPIAAEICISCFDKFNASVSVDWPEFPSVEVPKMLLRKSFKDGCAGFVAVKNGEVVGSNLVDMRDEVACIGPITSAEPGAGRLLMQAVMKAAAEAGKQSVRLVQIAANQRSFGLYLSLGFDPRMTTCQYEGFLEGPMPEGYSCAPLGSEDAAACSALHFSVCGVHRLTHIEDHCNAPHHPACVVRDATGDLVAYSTGLYLGGHSVAKSEEALRSVVIHISRATAEANRAGGNVGPPNVFVQHAYPQVMRWLTQGGFKLIRQAVSMGYGPYAPPSGGLYLPAIAY